MDFDSNNVQIMSISNKRARGIRVALVTIAACMYVIRTFQINNIFGIYNGMFKSAKWHF